MCKEVKGQARMFDDTTPEAAFREDVLEQVIQCRQLLTELVSEIRQLKGITAAKQPKTAAKGTPHTKAKVRDRYAETDRLIIFGKDGKVEKVFVELTAKTARSIQLDTTARGTVSDALVVVPRAIKGHRSSWREKKDGTWEMSVRKVFVGLVAEFEWAIYSLEPQGQEFHIGTMIRMKPDAEAEAQKESEESDA